MAQDESRTQMAVAKALGTHQALVSGWLTGRAGPGARFRDAIAILTEGFVPSSAWRTAADQKHLDAVQPMKRAGT